MCENTYCEYPFGYEALQIVTDESELVDNPLQATMEFFAYPSKRGNKPLSRTTDSILGATTGSMSIISELDRSSLIGDGDELSLEKQENFAAKLSRQELKRRKAEQIKEEFQANLNNLKKSANQINKLKADPEDDGPVIKNQKWLKTLKAWENDTGRKMLKEQENVPIENELTISIGATSETGASLGVNIQLLNMAHQGQSQKSQEEKKKKKNGKDEQ